MALNENAVKREAREIDRTEQSMKMATATVIGFPSVHSAPSTKGPSAPSM